MNYIYQGKELSAREIKALNPNTVYKDPTQVGAVPILPTPKGECGELERRVRDGVEIDGLGNTVEKWKTVPMFTADIELEDGTIKTVAEQEHEYLTKKQADAIEQARAELTKAIENLLNTTAKEFRYDDIKSARASAGVPLDGTESDAEVAIHNESLTLAKWDRAVWAKSTEIEAAVLAGTRTMPTVEELLSELPKYNG